MYKVDTRQFNEPRTWGRAPPPPLSPVTVCVSEPGMLPEAATPPFHDTMRPEAGICSFLIPAHAHGPFQVPDGVTSNRRDAELAAP